MLGKLFPQFVISRVIQTSYHADYMAVQLLKQTFGEGSKSFYVKDPKKYFECNFYSYIASLPAPTEFVNQYEAQKYEQSIQKLKNYNEVFQIWAKINEFVLELRELYRVAEVSNTSSNFFARPDQTDYIYEEDVLDALQRYKNFLDQLESYPEWKSKTIEQVGKWFLLIHNNLSESETKRKLFDKLDRQEYFV